MTPSGVVAVDSREDYEKLLQKGNDEIAGEAKEQSELRRVNEEALQTVEAILKEKREQEEAKEAEAKKQSTTKGEDL